MVLLPPLLVRRPDRGDKASTHSSRIPFYGYARLVFLLYLILPQTQGARVIYEERIHPFLQDNETQIDDFITTLHDRLKATGLAYVRQAIEYIKTNVLGLPPSPTAAPEPSAASGPQSYTQSLLARFSVPTARWPSTANPGADFYSLLAGAVSTAVAGRGGGGSSGDLTASGTLIPSNLGGSDEKMSFITAQRERLNIVLSALDREALELQREDTIRAQDRESYPRAYSMTVDGTDAAAHGDEDGEPTQRPPSGLSMWSALSKSRSEADFEKIEAESEDEAAVRRRNVSGDAAGAGGSWMPWGWGSGATPTAGDSSGVER